MSLDLEEIKKKGKKNPRKLGLLDTKVFENHYSGVRTREVGGWAAWPATDDSGGGIWSPAVAAWAPTCRRMGNKVDLRT